MVPVVQALRQIPGAKVAICVTAQHRQMLDQVLDLFALTPDFDLDLMRPGQDLCDLAAAILSGLRPIFAQGWDGVLVHGDTTTSLAAALAAYYAGIPVAHVEAGLRSGNLAAPWPEEMNRRLTGQLAQLHFAPTATAEAALRVEGVAAEKILITGNTVIDTLHSAARRLDAEPALEAQCRAAFPFLGSNERMILVTLHRRESLGAGLDGICTALAEIAARGGHDVPLRLVCPVHPNPKVQEPVTRRLGHLPRVHLTPPQDYLSFVWLMRRAHLVLTDSGGIQEEAPALGTPVLVLRDTTERPEAVAAGRLSASLDLAEADAYLIAVPTPFGAAHQPDLSHVAAAAAAIAPKLRPGALVILESTVPVGATEALALWLAQARPDLTFPQSAGEAADIMIAHCPERVLPGKTLAELVSNDRVIGGMNQRSALAAEALYQRIVTGACLLTDARTAELCKLTENAARDVQIAFANELAGLCQKLGVNVWELIDLANRHPRVEILRPGPGVGGHCIAVDPWFLVASAPEATPLIRAARGVNDARPAQVLAEIQAAIAAVPSLPQAETANGLRQGTDLAPVPNLAPPLAASPRGGAGPVPSALAAPGEAALALWPLPAAMTPTPLADPDPNPDPNLNPDTDTGLAPLPGPNPAPLPVVALLGLSFKADIDDLRASPALAIAQDLAASGRAQVLVVEPHLSTLPEALAASGARLVPLETALAEAEVICALVRHSAFPDVSRTLRPGQKLLDFVGLVPAVPSLRRTAHAFTSAGEISA